MDKRYQVFVSSTFEDLREERSAVIGALLQLDCIPAGMELFPAADEDSISLIKSVIDDCDYYVVIVAGRYGSTLPDSPISYTRMEYEYACQIGKPTIALLHSNVGGLAANKCEASEEGRKRLDEFRAELKKKNCRLWADRAELLSAVFTGVQHLKKTRPAVGWVKSSQVSDAAKDELLRLHAQVDDLTAKLYMATREVAPLETGDLAQGLESIGITVEYASYPTLVQAVQWREIIVSVLAQTYGGGATDRDVAGTLANIVENKSLDVAVRREMGHVVSSLLDSRKRGAGTVSRSDYAIVVNQLVALGLIEPRPHPTDPGATLWVATPYGLKVGSKMVAIRSQRSAETGKIQS